MTKLQDYYRTKVAQEAYDLFAVFAKFEYAMKKSGYRRENYPDAAWLAFAANLPDHFFEQMKIAPEAAIYFEDPPDHLVNSPEGGVQWSGTPKVPANAGELFDSIKTARNNLFHGDKRHDNRRDTALMQAALFILNAAFDAAHTLEAFDGFIAEMEYGL